MKHLLFILSALVPILTGCVSFYRNPSASEPATVFVERAETKDLEFVYVFNSGGTMTESSNYDAAPLVPPAYGVWKKVGIRKYEAKYQFFQSKTVSSADELVKGGGWAPDGYGTLLQKITLSTDGHSFDSAITLELFDKRERP